jgi:hypothetical protein
MRAMPKLCAAHGMLPSSYILTDGLEVIGDKAYKFGGFADIWKGRFEGRNVAIKALRVYATNNLGKIKKVGYTSALDSDIVSLFRCRNSTRKF